MAFTNSSVTLVHGMSRPIGANFHVSHGLSNAVLLSTVMEFSLIANPARFVRVAEAMGEDIYGFSDMEAAKLSVHAVGNLVSNIKIPQMQRCGIDAAIANGSPANNPRQISKEEINALYKKAFAC